MIAAIVPAAGRSERMGRPKLILRVGAETVIARVVAALREGGAGLVVVVVPPADAPGAAILADEAGRAGAVVIVAPERPADMRGSVELALDRLGRAPETPELLLLAPGDSLGITAALVARVVAHAREVPGSIAIPTYRGRRGHPIAFPWDLAGHVRALPSGVGFNALIALHAHAVRELDVEEPGTVADLNTPEDYRRWIESA